MTGLNSAESTGKTYEFDLDVNTQTTCVQRNKEINHVKQNDIKVRNRNAKAE